MQAGVKHFVFSGFEDLRLGPGFNECMAGRETSPGRFCQNVEPKGEVTVRQHDMPGDVINYAAMHTLHAMPWNHAT